MRLIAGYLLLLFFSFYVVFRALSGYNTSFIGALALLMIPFMLLLLLVAVAGKIFNRNFSNLSVLFVSLFAGLLLAEALLRIMKENITYPEILGQSRYFSPYWNDKNYWYVYDAHYPISTQRKDFTHQRLTNSLGIPERELNLSDASVKKILCLGDSFTEGIGAPEDSTWPRLLEKYLNMRGQDSFIVYNAGISGSDPVFQYHLLRGKLWDVNWNTVIFCINGTDIDDCKIRGGMERFQDSTVIYRKTLSWEKFYAASYLFRFLINNVLGYDKLLLTKKESEEYEKYAIACIDASLQKAKEDLQQRGINMVVIVHPLKGEADSKAFSNPRMDSLLTSISLLTPLNLLPYFSDSIAVDNKSKNLYWEDDAHFNPEGYRIMAEKISRELLQ